MLEGEFNSMSELYKTAPNFIPEPHVWGQLNVSDPNAYYFLCEFIEMTNQNPDPVQLCTKLVELHKSSKSPTGMFGFHVNTCQGNLPQQTAWNPSWVDFYIQLVEGAMQLNREINGTWKNLEQLVNRLISHVVPQVLRPLEADGRSVKPSLVHGGTYHIQGHSLWHKLTSQTYGMAILGPILRQERFISSMPAPTMPTAKWKSQCGVADSTKLSAPRST